MNNPQPPVLRWRKSSHSNAGNQCVEVARTPSGYLIRDSKDQSAPPLSLTPAAWTTLVADIKHARPEP